MKTLTITVTVVKSLHGTFGADAYNDRMGSFESQSYATREEALADITAQITDEYPKAVITVEDETHALMLN